ncbi:MAG TPA: hypothetical protein VGL56_10205 [Fimbriimonadaceae bacterium]|jgi:hypothetical protein
MPKNRRYLFFLLLAGTAGCASKQQAVFVDLDKVAASESLERPVAVAKPPPAPSFTGSKLSFPEMPASVYRLGSDKERVQEVERVMEQSRQQALIQIAARLKDAYLASINSAETLAFANFAKNDTNYQTAIDAVHQKFLVYADKRGPLVARLVLPVGFPDPDPKSQTPPPRSGTVAYNQFQLAVKLRAQIAELDKDFKQEEIAIFAKTSKAIQDKRQSLQQDFEKQRAAADAEAQKQALAEVQLQQANLRTVLADKSVVVFPAEPGHSVTVAGSTTPPSPPTVNQPGEAELTQRMRDADLSDLKIWAALHSYVISSTPRGARDATTDFIQWKKAHLATP